MAEPPRFDDEDHRDDHRHRDDRRSDDNQFNDWLNKRQPENDPPISASAAFLDMMRQAADRRTAEAPPEPPQPETNVVRHPAPSGEGERRPTPPPLQVERVLGGAVAFQRPPTPPPQVAPTPLPSEQLEKSVPSATVPPPSPDEYQPDATDETPPRSESERRRPRRVERISAGEAFSVVDDETGEPINPERRRLRRGRRAFSLLGGFFRSIFIIVAAAGLAATIFTWWTPPGFLPSSVRQDLALQAAAQPTTAPLASPMPTPNWAVRVGIVSGHRGPQNDPGAVCPDGLTEREINFDTAQMVVNRLQGLGYTVDLLDEFDPRLQNYQAAALLSIHANTCREWPDGEIVSGYLLAAPAARVTARGNDELLVDCISRAYAGASGLTRREGTTIDMTDYHNFREIHPLTPGAIIELGFMRADRDLLLQSERLGQGLTQGLLCFLEPLRFQAPTALPTPADAPTPTTQG
ncbi:MAG: N-acetylmuramoyl-L-alanine amidase [Chloroflexota bacterium]|nr:N-acetylmuramoyl-L-alanine amidase [Chloroflexota bacterium]